MDITAFKATLSADSPPEGLSLAVQALWQVAKGDWDQAHKLAQDQDDGAGAWVHAHLHRVEGDLRNAGHWYRKANREVSEAPLPKEWDEIAAALL
ncbi:MAG: hypothetical protein VCF08_00365 [Alphaproteobacteria bacterium]|jgi:hypothetical protein|nr:hypothetical protein [Alphaproteobacteria bacterium]